MFERIRNAFEKGRIGKGISWSLDNQDRPLENLQIWSCFCAGVPGSVQGKSEEDGTSRIVAG